MISSSMKHFTGKTLDQLIESYVKLVLRVYEIDPAASAYLRSTILDDKEITVSLTSSLSGAFAWNATPQGHHYWWTIDEALEKNTLTTTRSKHGLS